MNDYSAAANKIWIGRHSSDSDTLVFDPALTQPQSGNVTFFSLDHLRTRSFTPGAAESLISGITDPKEVASAKRAYKRWPELKAERDEAANQARAEAGAERRRALSERHSAFSATLPSEGEAVVDKPRGAAKRRRVSNCSACNRILDNGLNLECDGCGQRVCTCGACGCGVAATRTEVVSGS